MNWYILYCLKWKMDKLVKQLNQHDGIDAFVPQLEYYRRDIDGYAYKPLFANYVFVKASIDQRSFDLLLSHMIEVRDDIIAQLKYEEVSALREEEVRLLEQLLDDSHVLRMSKAVLKEKRAKVYEGPLKRFEKNIKKVDKHNRLAYLDIAFMNREIQAGLVITG